MKGEGRPFLLDALDALHVIGSRVERAAWCWRFRSDVTHDSALTGWQRFREGLRAHGVPAQLGSLDVVEFEPGARAAIERLLPPLEADDPDELERQDDEPAPRSRRISPHEFEEHARAVWSSALFATAGALHRELARQRPDLWASRARQAAEWHRRLEQEDRDRALGVSLTPSEAEIVDALRAGPCASARELRDRLAARSPWWASRAPVTVRVYIGRLRQRLRGGPVRLCERRLALEAVA